MPRVNARLLGEMPLLHGFAEQGPMAPTIQGIRGGLVSALAGEDDGLSPTEISNAIETYLTGSTASYEIFDITGVLKSVGGNISPEHWANYEHFR